MSTLCKCGFEDYLVQCQDGIIVNAGLAPATEYTWLVIDKFGKRYSGQVTTDAEGAFELEMTQFPAGLFTQYSGAFALSVFEDPAFCVPVKMRLARYYDEATFHIESGDYVKNQIGC